MQPSSALHPCSHSLSAAKTLILARSRQRSTCTEAAQTTCNSKWRACWKLFSFWIIMRSRLPSTGLRLMGCGAACAAGEWRLGK